MRGEGDEGSEGGEVNQLTYSSYLKLYVLLLTYRK